MMSFVVASLRVCCCLTNVFPRAFLSLLNVRQQNKTKTKTFAQQTTTSTTPSTRVTTSFNDDRERESRENKQ